MAPPRSPERWCKATMWPTPLAGPPPLLSRTNAPVCKPGMEPSASAPPDSPNVCPAAALRAVTIKLSLPALLAIPPVATMPVAKAPALQKRSAAPRTGERAACRRPTESAQWREAHDAVSTAMNAARSTAAARPPALADRMAGAFAAPEMIGVQVVRLAWSAAAKAIPFAVEQTPMGTFARI